ncbi:MAG: hypothetical protein ACOYXT_10640 [Bacteroidota bacterium]
MSKMDEQKFDDIIKNKLSGYEAPGFEPAALASLHHQIAAESAIPWYVSYRTELVTGTSIAIGTILILIAQWYWTKDQAQILKEEISALRRGQEQIDNLKPQPESENILRDTVRITEVRQEHSREHVLLLQRVTALEFEIRKLNEQLRIANVRNESQPTLYAYLRSEEGHDAGNHLFSGRINPRKRKVDSQRATLERPAGAERHPDLSPETIRDLEKHYLRGIGVKLGPALEVSKGFYSPGTSRFMIGYGLLTDLILSPSISLETGAKYFKRYYDLDNPALVRMPLPGVDESLGDLQRAEIDYWMLEVPLNLKYRYPTSLKTHWLIGAGYSPNIYLKQVFEYEYQFNDGSGNNNLMTHSTYKDKKLTMYPGTLNFSIGLNNQLKNKKLIETSIFYQHGLGTTGMEKIRTRFVGVRGVYWFTLR